MSCDPTNGRIEYEAHFWIDGIAPRCRKSKRHLRIFPNQWRFEINDELPAAAVAEVRRFRFVNAARLVLTQVQVRDTGTGFRITTGSVDAPRVEEELV
jgi:hypothetical protein